MNLKLYSSFILNESLTPQNKLAIRFDQFWQSRMHLTRSTMGAMFDKAIADFCDEDNEKLIPWSGFEKASASPIRTRSSIDSSPRSFMIKRGDKPQTMTTPEKVVEAFIIYAGKVPEGSRYQRYNKTATRIPAWQPQTKEKTNVQAQKDNLSYFQQEPENGRRLTTNLSVKSAPVTGPISKKEKESILSDITDVIAILADEIESLPEAKKYHRLFHSLKQ